MIIFPNCKINLGLRILRKRQDGYHDLETVFYPLPIKDVLESIRADRQGFTASGIPIPGEQGSNLCQRAFELLRQDFPQLSPIHIYLHKNIPIGAGLGGGSADGACMLRLLNRQFQLQLSDQRLLEYAVRLGSDCPFFIVNTPCLGSGRGERLEPVGLDLSDYSFLLVSPGIHISTAWAFSRVRPGGPQESVSSVIGRPVREWAGRLINDFEVPVMEQYPELRAVRDKLYACGALYAAMSGSGSSFFGIFEKGKLPSLSFGPNYSSLQLT